MGEKMSVTIRAAHKDINKGAYQGELTCPFMDLATNVSCGSKAIRFVEEVTHNRLRYRCRKCGHTFQYDISNRPVTSNPYAAYKDGGRMMEKYRKIMRSFGMTPSGGSLKGGV